MRALAVLLGFLSSMVWAQDPQAEFRELAWQPGPMQASIGDKATIQIPQGYVFLDASNTRRFLELTGNPPEDGYYMFGPESLDWWAVFRFNPIGYVKDDERIDPDALLTSIKDTDTPSNEERRRLGMEELYTDGWQVPPHYDTETKRLEWGLRIRSASGKTIVNYTSRLLGRTGVMSATLVGSPQTLAQDTQAFKTALKDFGFVSGERYAEYKAGDRVAEYGLAALIVGGAAAVATKKGFWAAIAAFIAGFWKLIVAGGVAAAVGLKRAFTPKSQ